MHRITHALAAAVEPLAFLSLTGATVGCIAIAMVALGAPVT